MTGSEEIVTAPRNPGQLALPWDRTLWRLIVYIAGSVVLGAAAGLLWSAVTPRASYTVLEDLSASISERGQAEIVAADVTFTFITAVLGLLVGVIGWLMLHRRGWWVIVATLVAAIASSVMAWRFGVSVGPHDFVERLASAGAGDVVEVDLTLRSMSALLIAPFAAIIPIMLLSAFWPEAAGDQDEATLPLD
ncbi:hypothetical protein [Tessaracoccus lacteus]|uniref:DUF2567 domain-containing protein n=1 Tax=Tessaracoccus lacteus TaxID=3041766 RepID=A0ABY8PU90_9ACTN|nr:hypothetical protein [Tessaracoccus sp. T21]WGT45995.1 hypothetical protein QH948_07375 [Tessaracoccus sp. T21]